MMTPARLRIRVSKPQAAFIHAPEPFPAFVGGFGSGKTAAGVLRLLRLKFAYPAQDVAYYLPTYDLVRLIGYPRFAEVLDRAKVRYAINRTDHMLSIPGKGRVLFRTLDTPGRIIGYEVADSVADELDTLKPADAAHAWRQIVARNRQKKPDGSRNSAAVVTTPEGFRFVYERWQKDPGPGYRLIRAATSSNARNLPDGYVEALKSAYPAHLIGAYLDGTFVNLTRGAVYPDFDRHVCHSDAAIEAGEALHAGVDFNVYNCTVIIAVVRDGKPVVVTELTGLRDTPAVVAVLRERFSGHPIHLYPDASGQSNRTVNASDSDIDQLRRAGFFVHVRGSNPLIKERVTAVNALIRNASGERVLRVNTAACPVLTSCLEQQVYDANGLPDKTSGHDHSTDALGYFIHFRWPAVKPAPARIRSLVA